jgi:MFS transporter, DHA3 family, macrolide efflux protein
VLALVLVFAGSLQHIYIILFILSTVSTFFVPAQSVTLRTLVPLEGLMSANALMQQAFQVMRIISPALAGSLVAWFGPSSCYYLDSASFLFSAALITTLTIAREPVAPAKGSHPILSVLQDLSAGVRFIFTHATISFVVLAMAAAMFAISCFGPLIAVYVRDELKASSVAYGIISSLIGFGMITGSTMLARLARGKSKVHIALSGLLAMSGFVLLMAAVRHVAAVSVSMFGIGISVMAVIVSAQTLMQGKTPVHLMGRVSSSIWAVMSIAQLIGLVLSGAYAQLLGIRSTFYASAVLILLITLFGYFRIPQQLKTQETPPQVPDTAY